MSVTSKVKHIAAELKGHAPFTVLGALTGILFMWVFSNLGLSRSGMLFSIFHPGHVVLSAMVTASIFILHRKTKNFLLILVVGYIGSVGIATLSDSVIPYIGESLFGLNVPTHTDIHSGDEHKLEADSEEHKHKHGLHLGFIEEWYIVNPAAVLGVFIAYFIPRTKFPHAGHVLISTWASSSHILMNTADDLTVGTTAVIFVILFLAVWLPCCMSDIIFPLLFVKSDLELTGPCKIHAWHSHPHTDKEPEHNN